MMSPHHTPKLKPLLVLKQFIHKHIKAIKDMLIETLTQPKLNT